jgi:hypothetical protein
MRNIVGDGGHGYGIMQIDDRAFPEWVHSGLWKDAAAGVQKGALVLDGKREAIRLGQGKSLKVAGYGFTGVMLSPTELLRTAVAAYNSGLWAYYSISKTGDPDARTTGKDYSKDVLARQKVFESLL